tara:strand:- start:107 stop:325 length:219 start_codon:yes stop_codon:yes gene_type:complete
MSKNTNWLFVFEGKSPRVIRGPVPIDTVIAMAKKILSDNSSWFVGFSYSKRIFLFGSERWLQAVSLEALEGD